MILKLRYTVLLPVFSLAMIFGGTPSLKAQSFFDNLHFAYRGTVILFAADNGPGADPSQIVPSLGLSVSYPILDKLSIEFTEDIYFTNYEYNFAKDYAMACSYENRKTFVLGFTTGFQATGAFPISSNGIIARAYGGLAFDIRFSLQAFGLHPDDESTAKAHTNAVSNYFWGSGRFLFVPVGGGMDFPISSGLLLGFDLRVWIPVYRLWTDENNSAINGWRFGLGLRVTPVKK